MPEQTRPSAVAVAWTGHRPYYFRDPEATRAKVMEVAKELAEEHGPHLIFITGGQRGVDNWAALAARDLAIPVHLYLPLPIPLFTQDWDPAEVAELREVWDYAEQRTVVDESGVLGHRAYDARNEAMVDACDQLVAVWTGVRAGGTFYTIRYAQAKGKPIRFVMAEYSGLPLQPEKRGL